MLIPEQQSSITYSQFTSQSSSVLCRDYSDHPEGFVYELAGESVVPGIDAQNMESIFEEHVLCSHLDPLVPQRNVFATAERKFDFGAVLAAVGGPSLQSGVKANLKFTNPHKVSCCMTAVHLHSPAIKCSGLLSLQIRLC